VGTRSVAGRRLAILADGHLDAHFGKTALGVVRYRPADVVAVIDGATAGSTTGQRFALGGDIPIVATLSDALALEPDSLLIGVATRGGLIPYEWRPIILEAIRHRLDIICGLHQFLSDDPQIADAAVSAGVQLIDVRKPPPDLAVAQGGSHRAGSTVITMVGSDCAVGKMSVALDIQAHAETRHLAMGFVATGQTGIMIDGEGVPLDRIIGDFMSGAVEREVLAATERHEIVLVEGQGSLLHPAYSGVTLALIHGSRPDGMILVVMPARREIDEYHVEIPTVTKLIDMHESAAAWIRPAPVIAIAVNSFGLTEDEKTLCVEAIHIETGLPVADTFRSGAGVLVDAVTEFHRIRSVVSA
jgi:uncharacterized NAD-dependent epimerase/dehydratase family protein